jgi:hypothetical protein
MQHEEEFHNIKKITSATFENNNYNIEIYFCNIATSSLLLQHRHETLATFSKNFWNIQNIPLQYTLNLVGKLGLWLPMCSTRAAGSLTPRHWRAPRGGSGPCAQSWEWRLALVAGSSVSSECGVSMIGELRAQASMAGEIHGMTSCLHDHTCEHGTRALEHRPPWSVSVR